VTDARDRVAALVALLGLPDDEQPASWRALVHAADRLPPDLLDWCAREHPPLALVHAAHRLPPDLLDRCARSDPEGALACAAKHLPPALLDWCRKQTL
jgi:hypothetical protein